MEIFISRSGQRHGPYSLEQVNAWLISGELNPTDLAWYEGASNWTPVGSLSGTVAKSKTFTGRRNRRDWIVCLAFGFLMIFLGFAWMVVVAFLSGNPFSEMNPQKTSTGIAGAFLIGGVLFSLIYIVKLLKNR